MVATAGCIWEERQAGRQAGTHRATLPSTSSTSGLKEAIRSTTAPRYCCSWSSMESKLESFECAPTGPDPPRLLKPLPRLTMPPPPPPALAAVALLPSPLRATSMPPPSSMMRG